MKLPFNWPPTFGRQVGDLAPEDTHHAVPLVIILTAPLFAFTYSFWLGVPVLVACWIWSHNLK